MEKSSPFALSYRTIFLGVCLFLSLYLISSYNYLLFHSFAEIFSVVIAGGIFMMAWNSRLFLDNNYFLFIGIAYLFVGVSDLIHTLAYKGMGVFPGYETNLATQLWIATRYIESFSLFIAPYFLRRKLNIPLTFLGLAMALLLLLMSIFYWGFFPVCFIEGIGLTPFKKISEFIISLILLASILRLRKNRKEFDQVVWWWIVGSIALTIASELTFTFYTHAYAFSNLLGHFLKILSFYFIYKAIIETGLEKPYDLLFRSLKQSRDELELRVQKRTADLAKTYELLERVFSSINIMIAYMDKDFNFIRVNRAYAEAGGRTPEFYGGKNHFALYPHEENERIFRQVVETGEPYFGYEKPFGHAQTPSRRGVYMDWSLQPVKESDGRVEGVVLSQVNVTARKLAEEAVKTEYAFRKSIEDSLILGIAAVDLHGRQSYVNGAFCRMFGWSEKELLGKTLPFLYWPPEEQGALALSFQSALSGQSTLDGLELRFQRRNGERFDALVLFSPQKNSQGEIIGAVGSFGDITRHKEIQRRIQATNILLGLFVKKSSLKEYLDTVVELMRSWSGCRCVGVRVLDEEGYIPYESYTGFSQEFWRSENWLSLKENQCACIRVITGHPHPQDSAIITPAGSFRCENMLKFVAQLTEEEQAQFRGVCIQNGFLSLAVVPIRHRDVKLGVIHLADEGEGKVALPVVEFIESMTPLLGEALYRFKVEKELQRTYDTQGMVNSLLRLAMENIPLDEILQHALRLLISIPWLSLESMACIYLVEEGAEVLVRVAQNNLSELKQKECLRLPFGRCLCGRAAWARKIKFVKGSEDRHEIMAEEDHPHAHYFVPLLWQGQMLGIINVYLKEGHRRNHQEEEFLTTMANTLAVIIARRRTEEALRSSENHLRLLSSQLITVQEKERKRVAQELHDGIGQMLTAIKFKIENTQLQKGGSSTQGQEEAFKTIIPMLAQSLEEVRRIQMDLRPSILDDLGILATLRWVCREFQSVYAAIHIEKEIDIQEHEIPQPLKTVIYRVVQEALNNIAKHSKADRVSLSLRKLEGQIVLVIADNGTGFDPKIITKGFGLASMKERTELAGGNFSMESTPGFGTRVQAMWPGLAGETLSPK